MTGLPAARQTDKTLKGGPITQGSLTVNIGSAGGVACSTCPGGKAVGNPVNPVLGAKVQGNEVDLALPGPLPFVVSRDYSSYQTDTPANIGLLGPGWWLPTEVSLLQTESEHNFLNPFEPDREDPYAVFIHEFRHLMDGNLKLYPGDAEYKRRRLMGTSGTLDVEKDADSYAMKLLRGKCECGTMQ